MGVHGERPSVVPSSAFLYIDLDHRDEDALGQVEVLGEKKKTLSVAVIRSNQ
jgi:hypothetical protein